MCVKRYAGACGGVRKSLRNVNEVSYVLFVKRQMLNCSWNLTRTWTGAPLLLGSFITNSIPV